MESTRSLHLDLRTFFRPPFVAYVSDDREWQLRWCSVVVAKGASISAARDALDRAVQSIQARWPTADAKGPDRLALRLAPIAEDSWLLEITTRDPDGEGHAMFAGALMSAVHVLATHHGATHVQGLPVSVWLFRTDALER